MRLALLSLVLGLAACNAADETPPAAPPPTPPEVEAVALGDMLPDALLGQDRLSLGLSRDGALGAEVERAHAQYGEIDVAVTDFGSAEMTEMMGYAWALAPGAERIQGHPGVWKRAARSASVRIVVGGRFLVEVTAPSESDALAGLQALDLTALG